MSNTTTPDPLYTDPNADQEPEPEAEVKPAPAKPKFNLKLQQVKLVKSITRSYKYQSVTSGAEIICAVTAGSGRNDMLHSAQDWLNKMVTEESDAALIDLMNSVDNN